MNKKCFLMFPVPRFCLCSTVPLKIWSLFPCSLEINHLHAPFSPVPQNPWKGLIYTLGNLKKSELKIILTGQVGCVGCGAVDVCCGGGGGGGGG